MLLFVESQFVTNVSGQPIGPRVNQAAQGNVGFFKLRTFYLKLAIVCQITELLAT
jgi:hypothetical protein